MKEEFINKCTFCGNDFNGYRVVLKLKIDAFRKKDSDVWEEIENLDVVSNEVLCKECFDDFAETITKEMEEKAKKRGE
jgi:hypothetical protein